jgi:hypothetical protein
MWISINRVLFGLPDLQTKGNPVMMLLPEAIPPPVCHLVRTNFTP